MKKIETAILLTLFCRHIDTAQSVKAPGITNIRQTLRNHFDQKRLIVANPHICGGMAGKLRLTPTLCRKETECDHFPLLVRQPFSSVIISETVA